MLDREFDPEIFYLNNTISFKNKIYKFDIILLQCNFLPISWSSEYKHLKYSQILKILIVLKMIKYLILIQLNEYFYMVLPS